MASFDDLPLELVTEILSYLPRRDRITCSTVCLKWGAALDSPSLWKNLTVHIDADFSEPTTETATKLYHNHFKSMELAWENPYTSVRWMQQDLQKLTKKACHYLMMLQSSCVQLNSIKFVDWYEVPKFKKIIYHLCKFLRSQTKLVRVGFLNANFTRTECIKLLASCLESVETLKYLNISNCHHAIYSTYESVTFMSCIEHLCNLQIVKIDYSTLSRGALEALITSRNRKLKCLEVSVRERDNVGLPVSQQLWRKLRVQCPFLKVALHLRNLCHFDDIRVILQEAIPLTTFSLNCGSIWDQSRSLQYRKTISLLISNYCMTLENVHLQTNYNHEVLDDLLLDLIKKCINLKRIDFQGVIGNMDLLREICKIQTESDCGGFKFFRVVPRNIDAEDHYTLTKLHNEFAEKLKSLNIDFKICNAYNKNMVYVYY